METIDRFELEQLLASEGGPHVTVYLPAPERPMEAKNDAIRISNLTRDAVGVLREHWMREQEAEDFVKPLRDLAEDEGFLGDRPSGAAVFLSEDCFKTFVVHAPVKEQLTIDRRFRVRPLLVDLQDQLSYLVLRLSKKGVTLLSVTPNGVSEMALEDLPESFEASLAGLSSDRGSQTHSAANASGAVGKQAAVFHGQGGLPDAEKAELTDYLSHVDGAVCAATGEDQRCLILAGVEYETAMYRNLSKFPSISVESIVGNMDHLSPEQLAERAKPIAAAESQGYRQAEAERIRERRHESVASDPERVLEAAFQGRVKTLFLNQNAELSGSFDPENAILKELPQPPSGQPGDPCHDLIESAVVQTLKHGGDVYAVDETGMPIDGRMVAALRF